MEPEEQELRIKELEVAIERLQALYNQYFMGIEKLEPTIARKDVERKISMLRKQRFHKTALRFRFQSQVQKYNTLSTYWRRICRQIEEGTYKRDVRRAQARLERPERPGGRTAVEEAAADASDLAAALDQGESLEAQLAAATEEALDAIARPKDEVEDAGAPPPPDRSEGVRVTAKTVAAARRVDRAANGAANALSEERLRKVYRTFLAARKRTNENTKVSFDKVVASLRAAAQKKPGVKDFKVVIRNGKAVIKPVRDE